jgi:hypothetical protein
VVYEYILIIWLHIKKRRNSEQETSTQEKFKSLIACQMRGQSQEQCVQDFQHVSSDDFLSNDDMCFFYTGYIYVLLKEVSYWKNRELKPATFSMKHARTPSAKWIKSLRACMTASTVLVWNKNDRRMKFQVDFILRTSTAIAMYNGVEDTWTKQSKLTLFCTISKF